MPLVPFFSLLFQYINQGIAYRCCAKLRQINGFCGSVDFDENNSQKALSQVCKVAQHE